MSAKSVQFAVAAHIMAALGYRHGKDVSSAVLADSVNADPTFVRKSLSKLSKAGLVVTKRGKGGASVLARSPRQITLLDIYRASAAPRAFAIHSYPIEKRCPVSCHLKECMSGTTFSGSKQLREIARGNNSRRSGWSDPGKGALTFFGLNCAYNKHNTLDHGGSGHGFICCFQCDVCDFGG
jgi:DNA-binding IscR family transcriptional regulator